MKELVQVWIFKSKWNQRFRNSPIVYHSNFIFWRSVASFRPILSIFRHFVVCDKSGGTRQNLETFHQDQSRSVGFRRRSIAFSKRRRTEWDVVRNFDTTVEPKNKKNQMSLISVQKLLFRFSRLRLRLIRWSLDTAIFFLLFLSFES